MLRIYTNHIMQMTDCEGHAKFIAVITLSDNIVPSCEDIDNGYKIKCGETVIYINKKSDGKVMHKNCINIMDGITTDAVMVIKEKYAVVNGSIVRKNNVSYLNTWVRITGWTDTAEKIF